jgi:hypothetical protein
VYTDTYEEIVVAWFGSQLLGLLDGSLELGAECDGHFERCGVMRAAVRGLVMTGVACDRYA